MSLDEQIFGLATEDDDTRRAAPTSDTLSEAAAIQMLMDLLYSRHEQPRRPTSLTVNASPVVAYASPASDAPAGLAQHMDDMNVSMMSHPEKADGVLDMFSALGMSSRDVVVEADPYDREDDLDEDTLFGAAIDPSASFATNPPGFSAGPTNTQSMFGGIAVSTINPLAELLRPDIADISRLGGGFSGYTEPDRMLERIRQLVRRL